MEQLSLSEWAAVGKLVGTLAVFVSLIFVIYGINQNTAAIQGSTENLIFERNTNLTNNFMLDPSLAETTTAISTTYWHRNNGLRGIATLLRFSRPGAKKCRESDVRNGSLDAQTFFDSM